MPTRERFADTEAAVPLLDPPGSLARSNGLRVSPLRDEVENHDVAKSGIVVFARMIAPAAFSLPIAVASTVGV